MARLRNFFNPGVFATFLLKASGVYRLLIHASSNLVVSSQNGLQSDNMPEIPKLSARQIREGNSTLLLGCVERRYNEHVLPKIYFLYVSPRLVIRRPCHSNVTLVGIGHSPDEISSEPKRSCVLHCTLFNQLSSLAFFIGQICISVIL